MKKEKGGKKRKTNPKKKGRYCIKLEIDATFSAPEEFVKEIASKLVVDFINEDAIVISDDTNGCQVIKVEINADSEITVIYDENVVFNGGVEMHYFSVPTGGYGVGYDIHDRLQRMAAGTPPKNRTPYGVKKPPIS